MRVSVLIFVCYSTLFLGCKKLVEAPKGSCFIPYVDFVAYNVNPNTLEVSFTSIVAANGTITSHHWDFGDGTTYDGDTPPPHKYPRQTSAETKTYRIKYTVTNECGEAYWTNDIKIAPCLPDVKFTYKFLSDSTVQFTNTTQSATPVNYEWNFGDGTKSTSSATTVTKTYLFDGRYTVMLKATNDCGDNYFIATIPVCSKPVPAQKLTMSGCSTVLLDASASKNGERYQWNFGDGTVLPASPSESRTISYTYSKNGSYTITLKVINKNGCDSATTATQVTIEATSVVPNNNWSYSSDDLDFTFSRATVTNALNYLWNFGDGTTSSEQNPGRKTFSNPGVYTVTLGAANNCGDYTFSASVNVPFYKPVNNAPNVDFSDVVVVSASEIYYLSTNGKLYKTDTAGHWSSAINLPSALSFNNNTKLFKDLNNNLWIYGRGEVARFNASTQSWTSYYAATGYSHNTTINSLAVDNSGNLWTVADREVRRNKTVMNSSGNNHFSSVAFAPSTGRIWVTASNRDALYYTSTNGNQLDRMNLSIDNGADEIQVDRSGDIYFTTSTGLVRANSAGVVVNTYTSSNTGGLLSGAPKEFHVDTEGNIWVVLAGRLLKIPVNASSSAKNYSFTSELNGISSIDILTVTDNDNDILITKSTGHAAIQIK